jgi:hypothetical protein
MLAYTLNKQLDGNKILLDIQNLINQYDSGNNEKILVIQIKEIVNDSNAHIPKLEYKDT